MKHVLVLDDDISILTLIKSFLIRENYVVNTFTNGIDALKSLKENTYDIIISDLFMPEMNGDIFFNEVKKILPDIPFIFLTANKKLNSVKKIMKMGADDYLVKPIDPKTMITTINNTIEEKQEEIIIRETMLDSLIEKRDKKRLFSWKDLYGMKETDQANKIMSFLSRNIDQAGSFMWLEMLRNTLNSVDKDQRDVQLSRTMLDLIIESTEYIKKIFDDLKYVTSLNNETILLEYINLNDFLVFFKNIYENDFLPAVIKHNKRLHLDIINKKYDYNLEINYDIVKKILLELLYNGIKYSTDNSKINIYLDITNNKGNKLLEISYWNTPILTEPDSNEQEPILGIPYEYSEAVFDLFYTIERLPVRIEEEEWSQGTGLYIVRKLLQKMNGHITAQNIIMHTYGSTIPYVKVTVYIPLT